MRRSVADIRGRWAVPRALIVLSLALLSPLGDVRVQADPALIGAWEPVITGLPVPAVHSVMLHTGEVLFFRGDGSDDPARGYMTYKWDPLTGAVDALPPPFNHFCSGHSFLPDGRVLVTGGELEENLGAKHVAVFDPVTEQWTASPDMRDGRWYPTNIPQADGTTLIFAGKDQFDGDNPEVERFVPGGGVGGADLIEYLVGADKPMVLYPRMHLLPGGEVLRVGTEPFTVLFDPVLATWQTIASSGFGFRLEGTSVMLPPGHERIMIVGGLPLGGATLATNTAEIIDMSDAVPSWSYTAPMNHPRMHANVVILPDAKVFVAGGSEDVDEQVPVFIAEMFDPVAETWTEMAAQGIFRDYHSSAVLLPDGKVVWGGSDDNATMQVYAPPYLFQGPRPTVSAAPESVGYGATFQVTTPDAPNIASVVFMRPGATTHSVNMEQRYVPLGFSQLNPTTLELTAPTNGSIAPPGFYMLFLVDTAGIPSVAPFVRLGAVLPPTVSAGVDQTLTLPLEAALDGTVFGFNGPAGLSTSWSKLDGPGTVSFGAAGAVDTTAGFSASGSYVLRLTAVDGAFNVSDDVAVTVAGSATATTMQMRIVANSDDVEEFANGSINHTSSDLEMVDYSTPHLGVGIRFDGVDLPKGAEIFEAWIQFEAAEVDTQATLLTIEAEASDDAPIFTPSTNDVTSRARTAASTSWAPGPWLTVGEQGPGQRTADISTIVEEIVGRPGWASGNALALIITGTGGRVAESFETDPASSAMLHVVHGGPQDTDSDGVLDGIDNCLLVPNPLQNDYDGDESGDLCDDDDDDDGLLDVVETNTGMYVDPSDTGTSPMNADSDADGRDDGSEIFDWGTDPTVDDPDPYEPNDPVGTAASCSFSAFAIVDPLGERDLYNVSADPGDVIDVDLDADQISSPLDSKLRILDALGAEIASNDDAAAPGEPASKDSYLTTGIVASGLYTIEVTASGDATTGPYLLDISGTCLPGPAAIPTSSPGWRAVLAGLLLFGGLLVLGRRQSPGRSWHSC